MRVYEPNTQPTHGFPPEIDSYPTGRTVILYEIRKFITVLAKAHHSTTS
jgi:hypothetical protein